MKKQHQFRPKHRAPHGQPHYTDRLGLWCTAEQKRKFNRNGRSEWLRRLIDNA